MCSGHRRSHRLDEAAWLATLEFVIEAGGEEAVFVQGHGAVVGASYVRRQGRTGRANECDEIQLLNVT
jgi:hypothetical protein